MTWFVIRNHPTMVRKACSHLERQGFEFYNPTIKTRGNVEKQLFVGYMFAKSFTGRWRELLSTVGVSYLLMVGPEKPAEVHDSVVDGLKARQDSNGFVVLSRFSTGQQVRSIRGPLSYYTGLYEGQRDRDRAKVLFSIMGRHCSVILEEDNLVAA